MPLDIRGADWNGSRGEIEIILRTLFDAVLQLNFTKVDIEYNLMCSADFLEISDGA